MNRETVMIRVSRGVALLNERMPDWRTKLDKSKLNVNDLFHCVLAQVYDGFFTGRDELDLTSDDAVEHGFDQTCSEEYDTLYTEEWLKAINQ